MTGFVVHGHKYFEMYMLCIWSLNKWSSMEKVTTLTSKRVKRAMLTSHTLTVILSHKATRHHLFSTIRAQLYANEQRQDTTTSNGNASNKNTHKKLSDLQHFNNCQCERPLKFPQKQTT